MSVWVVNDQLTAIPGTRTMWHSLLDLVPGSSFVRVSYYDGRIDHPNSKPDLIIRPASYFGHLPFNCPQVVFFQEIHAEGTATRSTAVDVARRATALVWNSEYTKAHYPELADKQSVIIPIGIDEKVFVKPEEYGNGILWVGGHTLVKGWPLFVRIADMIQTRTFMLAMKDIPMAVPGNCNFAHNVKHSELPKIIGRCSLALCTSKLETQHLAGIEAGLCGVPIVTTRVGAYANLQDGIWGSVVEDPTDLDAWATKIADTPRPGSHVRQFWLESGYGMETWESRWTELVDEVTQRVA